MSHRLVLAALAAAILPALPAAAQVQTNERVLEVFGKDKCPEGYVCVVSPESERYRIPKAIRENAPSQTPNAQRDLAASGAAVSATGTGTCSNVGGGGWTGCWKAEMEAARAERKAKAADAAAQTPD